MDVHTITRIFIKFLLTAAAGVAIIMIVVDLVVPLVVEGFRRRFNKVNKSNKAGKMDALNQDRAEEHQRKLEQVLGMANMREEITNDEVEKALLVSNTSAERYLDELEKLGKLKQIGRTGKSVTYKRSYLSHSK